MQEKTLELIKKFEQDYEINVSVTEALTYWIVYARIQKSPADGTHHLHHGRKYVSGPNEDGNVLVLRDPFVSDVYSAETWGKMESVDDFVEKALARIIEDKNAADKGQEEGCGTSCG
ncbi:MAG: hypothetical protein EHM53_04310 [Methanoregulaceae archaeon]|nr:MAG: hypothetical protein EHM53_04310 [Methanoregulaceae archaeon]